MEADAVYGKEDLAKLAEGNGLEICVTIFLLEQANGTGRTPAVLLYHRNWRQPLYDIETAVELIGSTTNKTRTES